MQSQFKNIFMCTSLMLTALLFGQKQEPPVGGAPKDFNLPQKEVFSLTNGMNATLVPYGNLPKVTVRLIVRAGNIDEAAEEVWLADLVGELMKEGTTSRNAEAIAAEAASMGGTVNINVGPDQTTIEGDVLSEFAPALVKLLADIVRNPSLPESEIARLKNDLLRNLSIQKSSPQSLTLEKFRQQLYPNHSYGRLFPTEAMVQNFTIDKVRDFYRKNFGASRAHIYVAGRFDSNTAAQAIRAAFSDWEAGSPASTNIPNPVSKRVLHLIDRPGAAQSTIYLGLPVINPKDKDYRALLLTNTLLGGFFSSRVTANIRENKGYTYSPFSSVSSRYRDAYWLQVADVTTEVTGPALNEIFHEIDRLQNEAPSEEELDGVKNYMAGTFVLQNSSRNGIINQLAFLDLHGLDDSYLTDYVKTIQAVTPAEVQRLAQTYLKDEQMTIVITGDLKKIKEQVWSFREIVN